MAIMFSFTWRSPKIPSFLRAPPRHWSNTEEYQELEDGDARGYNVRERRPKFWTVEFQELKMAVKLRRILWQFFFQKMPGGERYGGFHSHGGIPIAG